MIFFSFPFFLVELKKQTRLDLIMEQEKIFKLNAQCKGILIINNNGYASTSQAVQVSNEITHTFARSNIQGDLLEFY